MIAAINQWAYVVAAYAHRDRHAPRLRRSHDRARSTRRTAPAAWGAPVDVIEPTGAGSRPGVDEPDDRDLDDGGLDLTPRGSERPAGRLVRAAGGERSWCS